MPDSKHDWRLIQVLLSSDMSGVYEVETDWGADSEEISLRCSCDKYRKYESCAHTEPVRDTAMQIEFLGGFEGVNVLPLESRAPIEELTNAVEVGGEVFRSVVLKYGRIGVL